MASRKVRVRNSKGIHVRPAGLIVSSIKGYKGKVEVVDREGKRASLQSILSLLSLGLSAGEEVTVEVDGPDAERVCAELSALFARHFDFPQT
ncbi:MAG: HPr family phosphocarrier protein [Lentisphaeria bacterium]|nr:HPr family phosphocarrier protein [Lentisphaeria bacterium]MDY0175450.1 HPr family phosphocarrier protein [Lentisphaeria bacterium]